MGYVPVENDASEERSEDAFQSHQVGERRAKEENGQYKDKLHDGVAVASEKPSGKVGHKKDDACAVGGELNGEPYPKQRVATALVCRDDSGHQDE